jgi:uncharacterized protein YukE
VSADVADAAALRFTAQDLDDRADRWELNLSTLKNGVGSLPVVGVWEGDAATELGERANELLPDLDSMAAAARQAADALRAYASRLDEIDADQAALAPLQRELFGLTPLVKPPATPFSTEAETVAQQRAKDRERTLKAQLHARQQSISAERDAAERQFVAALDGIVVPVPRRVPHPAPIRPSESPGRGPRGRRPDLGRVLETPDRGMYYYGFGTSAVTVLDRVSGVAVLKKAMPKSGLKDWTQDWEDLKRGTKTAATDALDADKTFSTINKVSKVVDSPLGKGLGVVGVGFSAYDAVQDFSAGKVWDGAADSLEAGLGIAALLTPPPADLVVGAAALAVGLTQIIMDNHVAIEKSIGNAVSTVSSVADHLTKDVVDVEKNIGKGLLGVFASIF